MATSEEVTEMMAFERIEPFGGLHDEQMHGATCAVIANVNRDPKKASPFSPGHFMAALGKALGVGDPVHLKDKRAMSELIMTKVFGVKAKKRG